MGAGSGGILVYRICSSLAKGAAWECRRRKGSFQLALLMTFSRYLEAGRHLGYNRSNVCRIRFLVGSRAQIYHFLGYLREYIHGREDIFTQKGVLCKGDGLLVMGGTY